MYYPSLFLLLFLSVLLLWITNGLSKTFQHMLYHKIIWGWCILICYWEMCTNSNNWSSWLWHCVVSWVDTNSTLLPSHLHCKSSPCRWRHSVTTWERQPKHTLPWPSKMPHSTTIWCLHEYLIHNEYYCWRNGVPSYMMYWKFMKL
jgi:hypothetical protein